MRIWIDNTGFQSAFLCSQGKARNDLDVKGLFQFATLICFSDEISINGFEHEVVAENTNLFRDDLLKLGLNGQSLAIENETLTSYSLACRFAAFDIKEKIEDGFQPDLNSRIGIEPIKLPAELQKYITDFFYSTINENSFDYWKEIEANALNDKAAGAVDYIVASSPDVRDSIRSWFHNNRESWNDNYIPYLSSFIRFYLNHSLAEQNFSRYAPALGRAKIVRTEIEYIINKLSDGLDDLTYLLRNVELPIPSFAAALIQKSKGEPQAFIQEALNYRNESESLRKFLNHLLVRSDLDSSNGRHFVDSEIKILIHDLAHKLKVDPSKLRTSGALSMSLSMGVPNVSFNIKQLRNWIARASNSGKISVLTDVSKRAAFPVDEELYFDKFLKNCFKNR